MTLTEELRKVYSEESLKSWTGRVEDMHGSALLAVARFVAERQRAVEPTEEMLLRGGLAVSDIYAKEAKVEGLTFHCLRRTAATRLSKKLTVWELCSMFGWKDPKIPMKHYYAPNVEEIARKL